MFRDAALLQKSPIKQGGGAKIESWLSFPAQGTECLASLVSRGRDKGLTPETIWTPKIV